MADMRVTLIDYGIGNLYSVQRALECCGAEVSIASTAKDVDDAQRLVLPGVGAFADGMQGLRERGLVEPLRGYAASGRPLLGICLGMQMLAEASEEFGEHEGLGLVPGRVVPIPNSDTLGLALKIPHIGWNGMLRPAGIDWSGSMLETMPEGTPLYLVHSFHFQPTRSAHRLAECEYGGHRITAAVHFGAIIGCQFHPEKSGKAGLKLLSSFLAV